MHADDITNRDFFVGLRGYDKGEVDGFLSEVADAHARLQAELEEARASLAASPPPRDEIEEVGAAVVAVLQSARQTAGTITAEAQAAADRVRTEAETEADRVRHEAEAEAERLRSTAWDEAERARSEADVYCTSRRDAADHYFAERQREADERTETMRYDLELQAEELQRQRDEQAAAVREEVDAYRREAEARIEETAHARTRALESQVRNAVEAAVADANDRLQSTFQQLDELRRQLADAGEGIQLTLLSLEDPTASARATIEAAVPSIDLTEQPAPI